MINLGPILASIFHVDTYPHPPPPLPRNARQLTAGVTILIVALKTCVTIMPLSLPDPSPPLAWGSTSPFGFSSPNLPSVPSVFVTVEID